MATGILMGSKWLLRGRLVPTWVRVRTIRKKPEVDAEKRGFAGSVALNEKNEMAWDRLALGIT